jgi:site-specific recombinase XerD
MSDLEAWRDEWALALDNGEISRGSSTQYLRGVDGLLAWLAAEHPDVASIEQLSKQHINAWLTHLTYREDRPLKPATRRLRLVAVRMWLAYIINEPDSPLTRNPTTGVGMPVPNEAPVPVISDDDLKAMLAACSGTRFVDYRDTLIVRILLDCGIRNFELLGINLDDVDRKRQEFTVTGKGDKTRIVPYGSRTAIALSKYLRVRARHRGASSPALILSALHNRTDWRLTTHGVRTLVKRRAEAAGLGRTWPHKFRHTWAHDMKEAGASDEDLESLGGWSPGSPVVRVYGRSMAASRARNTARRMSRGDRV